MIRPRSCIGVVALSLVGCTSAPNDLQQTAVKHEPKGARIVAVVVPGLDQPLLSAAAQIYPNLATLNHTRSIENPVPPHPQSVWTTFETGRPPAEHGIFSGTVLGEKPYERALMFEIEPARIESGKMRPPGFLRRSQSKPFWHVLGEHGISAAVLFPPFSLPVQDHGVRLLAGNLPSLSGREAGAVLFVRPGEWSSVQGSQTTGAEPSSMPTGVAELTPTSGGAWSAKVDAMEIGTSAKRQLSATLILRETGSGLEVRAAGREIELRAGERSPYFSLAFRSGPLSLVGQTRVHLISMDPLRLLVEAATVDPQSPAFPISFPLNYATQVIGRSGNGCFGGCGFWNLDDGPQWMDQGFRVERLKENIEWKLRAVGAELDSSDARVVLAYVDGLEHARLAGTRAEPVRSQRKVEASGPLVRGAYLDAALVELDRGLGRIRGRLDDEDVLLLVGLGGVAKARLGVDLNAWLVEKRLLRPNDDGTVDWAKSQAYAGRDGAIYFNVSGRDPQGMVPSGRRGRLARKLTKELRNLRFKGQPLAARVWVGDSDFAGAKARVAPDLMVTWEARVAVVNSVPPGGPSAIVDLERPARVSTSLGVVVASNRDFVASKPKLEDFASTVLSFVGLAAETAGSSWIDLQPP